MGSEDQSFRLVRSGGERDVFAVERDFHSSRVAGVEDDFCPGVNGFHYWRPDDAAHHKAAVRLYGDPRLVLGTYGQFEGQRHCGLVSSIGG